MSKIEIKSAEEWDDKTWEVATWMWREDKTGSSWAACSESYVDRAERWLAYLGLTRPEPERKFWYGVEIIPCPEDVIRRAEKYADYKCPDGETGSGKWIGCRHDYLFSAGVAHRKASKQ